MIEAQKHPDGTFKGAIEEYDDAGGSRARRWVDFPFEKRNTGFEGLASVEFRGRHYLLALCEGNKCREAGRKARSAGRDAFTCSSAAVRMWHPVAQHQAAASM